MQVSKIPIGQLNPAAYNPRKDLKPGDPEYKKLNLIRARRHVKKIV